MVTATYDAMPPTVSHSRYASASTSELTTHTGFAPYRSESVPSGTASANVATPEIVRPSPTCAADRPTTWVKKTALPVRKTPSPTAESTDCEESRRISGVGPASRTTRPKYLDIKVTLGGCGGPCRPGSRRASRTPQRYPSTRCAHRPPVGTWWSVERPRSARRGGPHARADR